MIFGLPSLVVVATCIWQLPSATGDDRITDLVVGVIFALFGIPASVFGARLLFADEEKRRRGLMSPIALRIAGTSILLLPLIYLIGKQTWDATFALMHLGAGIACFAMAKHRAHEHRDPAEPPSEPASTSIRH
jgi:hypothetical protein